MGRLLNSSIWHYGWFLAIELLCGCDSDDERMNQHQDTFLGVLHGENKGLMLGAQHYRHCAGVGAGHQSHWSSVPLQPVYLVVSALGLVLVPLQPI